MFERFYPCTSELSIKWGIYDMVLDRVTGFSLEGTRNSIIGDLKSGKVRVHDLVWQSNERFGLNQELRDSIVASPEPWPVGKHSFLVGG